MSQATIRISGKTVFVIDIANLEICREVCPNFGYPDLTSPFTKYFFFW